MNNSDILRHNYVITNTEQYIKESNQNKRERERKAYERKKTKHNGEEIYRSVSMNILVLLHLFLNSLSYVNVRYNYVYN